MNGTAHCVGCGRLVALTAEGKFYRHNLHDRYPGVRAGAYERCPGGGHSPEDLLR